MLRNSYTVLNSGLNGSGLSGLISSDLINSQGEIKIIDRCLINVGDNTQRFCLDNQIKLSKLSLIVITSLSPHCTSGLPGVIHALANLGSGKLTIIGPLGIKTLIEIITPFTNRKYPTIECYEVTTMFSVTSPFFININKFACHFIPITSNHSNNIIALSGYISVDDVNDSGISIISVPGYFEILPSINTIIDFAIKFNKTKSNILFLLFPIGLIGMKKYISKYTAILKDYNIKGIIYDMELSNSFIEMKAAQIDIRNWNLAYPDMFPTHIFPNVLEKNIDESHGLTLKEFPESCLVIAEPFLTVILQSNSLESLLFERHYSRSDHIISENNNVFENAKNESNSNSSKRTINDEIKLNNNFRLTFLGTGSATPSKHRNNSSILLSFNCENEVSILLDIGEGVCNQLFYHCNGDILLYNKKLLSIKIIWISHYHGDHIAGLPMLLQRIYQCQCSNGSISYSKILVIVPCQIVKDYYEYITCISGLDDLITIVSIVDTLYAGNKQLVSDHSLGIVQHLVSLPVYHCQNAYAVIITFNNDIKLCYSGDCRPNSNFIRNGKNCDILIHEATFDDNMIDDAIKKKHCTINEALCVSQSMNAKYTFLTHFSQRYPSIPILSNDNSYYRYGIAFDFLSFKFPIDVEKTIQSTHKLVEIIDKFNNTTEDTESNHTTIPYNQTNYNHETSDIKENDVISTNNSNNNENV